MINRRYFIQGLTASAFLGMISPKDLLANPTKKMIGIQLYTIRDLVKSDFTGTLKILADIGYKTVEAAGYSDRKFYGFEPMDYAKICNDHGILPLSSHSGINPENADVVIEDTFKAGTNYIVLPSIAQEKRKTLDDYKKQAEEFNLIGEKCRNAGMKFGYHNHAFEFEKMEDQIPYDVLLESTDPELCFFQVDVYWMIYGGYDPFDYIKKYPGRFELWHVKDMDKGESRESTEIGQGIIDFPALFKKKKKSGLKYYFVEQEEFKMDMVESIKMSFNYLNNL